MPLRGEFAELSLAQRDALNVVLGCCNGPAPDRLTVFNATLELLRRAATARPVLVLVDDLPWLDRATAAVLGFVRVVSPLATSAFSPLRGREKATSSTPAYPSSRWAAGRLRLHPAGRPFPRACLWCP